MDYGEQKLMVVNTSGQEIACFVADGYVSGFSYPDVQLPPFLNPNCLTEHITDESVVYWTKHPGGLLSMTQNNVLSIYLFSQHDIETLGWDEITANNRYLVRYDLMRKDLDVMDRKSGSQVLYYPPTPSMKDIQMDPPF